MYTYFVYMISNSRLKPLYIGVTDNLSRRIYEHRSHLVDGFSNKYNLDKLLWYEEFDDIYRALEREKQLKNWHRQWKLNLIQELNRELIDLYDSI